MQEVSSLSYDNNSRVSIGKDNKLSNAQMFSDSQSAAAKLHRLVFGIIRDHKNRGPTSSKNKYPACVVSNSYIRTGSDISSNNSSVLSIPAKRNPLSKLAKQDMQHHCAGRAARTTVDRHFSSVRCFKQRLVWFAGEKVCFNQTSLFRLSWKI